MSARHLALDAEADGGVGADADREGEHEQEELRAPATPVHEAQEGAVSGPSPSAVRRARGVGGRCLAARLSTARRAASRLPASMPSRTLLGVEVGEPVERDVGGLVRRGQRDAGQVGVEAAEDHDACRPARRRSTAAGSRTTPRRAAIQTRPTTTSSAEQPLEPGEAARRPGRVAGLLGVDAGRWRSRTARRRGSRRRTGSSSPVSPERWPRKRLPLAPRRRACAARRRRRPGSARVASSTGAAAVDDVGDDAGDVVGAAGLEAGAHQLDRGVVGAAGGEDVGEPAVVEDAAGAVAAQQQPVAGARGRRGTGRARPRGCRRAP